MAEISRRKFLKLAALGTAAIALGPACTTFIPLSTPTPTETPTGTGMPTVMPPTEIPPPPSFETNPLVIERANRLAKDFNLEPNEITRRMNAIKIALTDAGINYGILDNPYLGAATNPQYPEGVIPNQDKNTWTVNYSEAATAFVSFGGGKIKDDNGQEIMLPNGVLDLSENNGLVSPSVRDYPYLSQVYQVIFANRKGEDVLPPETQDQDLNKQIVVTPNGELQYSYVARGAWQGNGAQQKRTVGADWLAEQILWGTGGGSNCGTGCGETTLILVQTNKDPMTQVDRNYITLAHVSAIYENGQPLNYKATRVMTRDYNAEGVGAIENYLAKKVLPTWPAR
ncbi:twin-arginine translocation signal domain-containing protein, partial [Candidatus Roizmanbacteria bacterium]|nr:twin-arginine translocation signal domain-containing protein [Candidatus Roizmanbacteria bacterium]